MQLYVLTNNTLLIVTEKMKYYYCLNIYSLEIDKTKFQQFLETILIGNPISCQK